MRYWTRPATAPLPNFRFFQQPARSRGAASLKTSANKATSSKLTRSDKMLKNIQNSLSSLFRVAAQSCKPKDVSWTAVDLASLWEVSVNNQRHIRSLLKCSYPRDRDRIETLLTEIQVNLLSQGADNLKTLQKGFPRIVSAVYRRGGRLAQP